MVNLQPSIALLSCIAALPLGLYAQTTEVPDKAGDAKKSPRLEKSAAPGDLLKQAATTMGTLTSYHASGTFSAGGNTATLSGNFGVGTLDVQVKGFDKKTTFRRVLKDDFWVSHDSGKTWQVDTEKETTALLSSVVTAPVSTDAEPWAQGTFKIVGDEKIGTEDVLHIQKPKEGESAAMDFWLVKDDKLGFVIRKASLTISANDGEFPVVMSYTKLNEPVKIEAPPARKPDKEQK